MAPMVDSMLRQLSFATHHIHTLPVLVLMPHGGCNCRCAMCDIWKGNGERDQIWRWEVAGWLDGLRNLRVRQVALSGGEALLHTDLWGICELIKQLPARITLLTNGLLLERNAQDVARWCDEVTVSLDGPAAVHDSIRGVHGAFETLSDGVAALKKAAPRLQVSARCTLQRRNWRYMAETVEAAWDMGLDRLSFLAADVSTPAFNRPEPWERDRMDGVALTSEEAKEFRAQMERFIASHEIEYAADLLAESPTRLRRLARYFEALAGDGDFPPVRCNAPWVSAVIESDGAVRPCFFHPAYGNVRERPLEAILNSPEAIAFRRSLKVQKNPICRKCVCTLYVGRT